MNTPFDEAMDGLSRLALRSARITANWCRAGRKPRKDAILRRLPADQRARVDRWLFDKNLTYAQVVEGCFKCFGVKISKSSVGRYFETETELRQAQKREAEEQARFEASPKVTGTPEENYQELLGRLMKMALEEARLPEELRDVKWFIQLMWVILATRRERNQAARVKLERDKYEVWAAKECLKHLNKEQGMEKRKLPENGIIYAKDGRPRFGRFLAKRNPYVVPASYYAPVPAEAPERTGGNMREKGSG